MSGNRHDDVAAMDLSMIAVALTPYICHMINMNFDSYASIIIFTNIPPLFCFVFEHETIYTLRVLAVFDFHYRRQAGNITERENLKNSDCPFRFLFEDYRLFTLLKAFFGSSVATCRLAYSENSLSINEKKLKRRPGKGGT